MNYREQSELEQQLAELRDSLPHLIGFLPHIAKLLKAHYDSLINAEFNEDQAIYLTGEYMKKIM